MEKKVKLLENKAVCVFCDTFTLISILLLPFTAIYLAL